MVSRHHKSSSVTDCFVIWVTAPHFWITLLSLFPPLFGSWSERVKGSSDEKLKEVPWEDESAPSGHVELARASPFWSKVWNLEEEQRRGGVGHAYIPREEQGQERCGWRRSWRVKNRSETRVEFCFFSWKLPLLESPAQEGSRILGPSCLSLTPLRERIWTRWVVKDRQPSELLGSWPPWVEAGPAGPVPTADSCCCRTCRFPDARRGACRGRKPDCVIVHIFFTTTWNSVSGLYKWRSGR